MVLSFEIVTVKKPNINTYSSRPCEVNTMCYTLSDLIAKQANTNTLKILWCDLKSRKHKERIGLYKTYIFYQTSVSILKVCVVLFFFKRARNHTPETH